MRVKLISFISIFLFSSLLAFAVLDLRFFPPIESPETINIGDRITFRVAFIAHGAPAENVKVTGNVDCDLMHKFEQIFDYVPSDTPIYVNFEWTAIHPSGTHFAIVTFQVDPSCSTGDSNCTNNGIDKEIEILGEPRALPDLKLTVTASPFIFKEGDKLRFRIEVRNIGLGNAKSCRLYIKHSNHLTENLEIPPLAASASTTITHEFPVKCNEKVTIIADALNQIVETDENNTWSKIIICNPRKIRSMTPTYTTTGNKK